jgi:hypothetical protein
MRSWKDKVTISRQDFFDILKAYNAKIILNDADAKNPDIESESEYEITHRFFDIVREHRK